MLVGTAWEEITPDKPLDLLGQMHVRKGKYKRDALTVNAGVFRDSGGGGGGLTAALVSVDVCILVDSLVREIQARCAKAHGIDANAVLIHSTHTHVAPCTSNTFVGEADPAFVSKMSDAIVNCVGRSLADLEECDLHAASGYVEQMGWNRRGLHGDNRCDMYHGSWNADFKGIEGPRDGQVPVIFARRKANGKIKLVVTGFTSHPNCVEGESFYSADLPGAVRRFLRRNLGDEIGVVYLTSAAGDTAPSIMENNPKNIQPWRGEDGLEKSGAYLGAEILQLIHASVSPTAQPMTDPVVRLAQLDLDVPVRQYPSTDVFDCTKLQWEGGRIYFTRERDRWQEIVRNNRPTRLNVLRLGDAAICTNPAELYCAIGLDIKLASPARMTMIAELTDGYVGYVATHHAYKRGGYSTWPGESCKLVEDADGRIVDATKKLMTQVF